MMNAVELLIKGLDAAVFNLIVFFSEEIQEKMCQSHRGTNTSQHNKNIIITSNTHSPLKVIIVDTL